MRMGGDGSNEEPLAWRRTDPFRDQFELSVGNQGLATLTIGGLAILTAQLETGRRQYGFRAEGVGSQRIKIWDADDGEVVGHLDLRWSRRAGTLQLAGGGMLEWRREGWWRWSTYIFADRFSNPLVRLCPDGRVLESLTGSWESLVLLVALGWFLLVVTGRARPRPLALPV
jgi:hypothetical protein